MSDTSELVTFRARRSPDAIDPRNNADAFEAKVLFDPKLSTDAYRLRHRAYADQGHIPLVPDAEYRDPHDALPTTALVGGFDRGRLVACMRLCFALDPADLTPLPCAPYYPALSGLAANAPHGIVEVSRLAIEPDLGNTSYRTTLYGFMVRSAFAAARAAGVSRIVVATRPEWVSTYKHLLSFDQVGEPALYPPGNMLITLLAGNLEDAAKRAWMRNRFFRISDREMAHMSQMLAPVLSPRQQAAAMAKR